MNFNHCALIHETLSPFKYFELFHSFLFYKEVFLLQIQLNDHQGTLGMNGLKFTMPIPHLHALVRLCVLRPNIRSHIKTPRTSTAGSLKLSAMNTLAYSLSTKADNVIIILKVAWH